MTDRYCVTCQKPIRGHAIGAHIQHKHTVRNHAPVKEAKVKKGIIQRAKDILETQKNKRVTGRLPQMIAKTAKTILQNNPAWTSSPPLQAPIDKAKAAEATHTERMLVLHEKTLDVILVLSKDPQLAATVGPLIAVLTDLVKKFPLWLLTAVAGITPALYATNLLGGK